MIHSLRPNPLQAFAVLGLAVTATVLVGCAHVIRTSECKRRGDAYLARVEKLKQDAHDKLKIGAPREKVAQFFADNGIPVTFVKGEATGTIYIKGCAPRGCGTDDALLGLRVKVDEAGAVISEPTVGALYTNCL
ncbi:MAG TPA: hypothetical protein VG498_01685 [Terriglobales bacterium]|nr:hypothetical protein [Terriglobales bacterium]